MNILLVSGFLGAGKTTVIAKLVDCLHDTGQNIWVIENEAGEFGVDDLVLSTSPVRIKSLSGGCVCCQLTGELIDALRAIRDEHDPEQVIVELSGLAYPAALPRQIERWLGPDCPVSILAVADAARWPVLSRVAAPLLNNQLHDSRAQIISKLEQSDDPDGVCGQVRACCAVPNTFSFRADEPLPEGLLAALWPGEDGL